MKSPLQTTLDEHVEALFRVGAREYRIFFRTGSGTLAVTPESRIAAALLPSMKSESDLVVEKPTSPKLLKGIKRTQDILCCWHDQFSSIDVRAMSAEQPCTPATGRVGCFFTGGVDSFYTLLKHKDEIDDLIFVHGFDISLEETTLREQTSRMIQKVASDLGKRAIEIETNLRTLLDSYLGWHWSHGSALATVAHVLAGELDRIYLPSTHTYSDLFPWGSHPLLDPLWSSEALQFVHDGCEANRVEKVELISEHEVALDALRVCHENPDGVYNCGTCEKCLRTMINLRCVGALERCSTFAHSLDLKRVARMRASDLNTIAFIQENLEMLEEREKNPQLQKALKVALTRLRVVERMQKTGQKIWARLRTLLGQ